MDFYQIPMCELRQEQLLCCLIGLKRLVNMSIFAWVDVLNRPNHGSLDKYNILCYYGLFDNC